MTWQLLLGLFLILSSTVYVLRRKLAQVIPEHNRFVNWFVFQWVLFPVGLITALIIRPDLAIGWQNLALLLVGELVFPAVNLLAYRASKDIDAGLYTILTNLAPLITIASAWLLLREGLTGHQLVGAGIILFSAFLASSPTLLRRHQTNLTGISIALISVLLLGLGITYERFMLTHIEFGAYVLYGWGAQALWMTILAWSQRKHMELLKRPELAKQIIVYGLAFALQGLCFVGALQLSGNASLIAASRSFLSVLVVLAAYFVLRERGHLWLKISAALFGASGLIILNWR
jgi:drug/metabolite transporter (DMT)-like permease